ncbi:hypothetical protein B0G77_7114 [Paraburkholderia sp. BL10I2N1]|nr:hypothetical protein B0G77_7114 [Paraburkholderia sp. BL10I2N1]
MGYTSDFSETQLGSSLVAAVVVTYQLAAPVTEEPAGRFARSAIGELIDHGAHVGELRGGIRPYVRALRLPFAGNQHLHGCFVGVQYVLLEKYFVQRVDQRLQAHTANSNPLARR